MYLNFIIVLIARHCLAAPFVSRYSPITGQESIPQQPLPKYRSTGEQREFAVPNSNDVLSFSRAYEVEEKRQGYLYGPSLLGNTSYFPVGILGDAMVQQHIQQWQESAAWVTNAVEEEMNIATAALEKVCRI